MSVNCKEIYLGGIGELVNPLQWPQLRKRRRLLLLVVTLLLLRLPFAVTPPPPPLWFRKIGRFPPLIAAPLSILSRNLPKQPPLPKVFPLSTFT
ncbi:hypothetical protein OIU78_016839 [Salix suchowensis]|nr:hypothetical protein OIU78_016839 [Salix suchowensis]